MSHVRIAAFGQGRWGSLLAAALRKAGAEVVGFDTDTARGADPLSFWQHVDAFDAVSITTPAELHFSIAIDALRAGKHVLVTKPLTLNAIEARQLAAIAAEKERLLWVDHTFLWNDAYCHVGAAIEHYSLGEIIRIESVRVNSWGTGHDPVWDLAPHDLSIWQWWLLEPPTRLHLERVGSKAAHLFAEYGRTHCHAYLAWDHAEKVRKMTVIGSRGSVQINGECVTWYHDGKPTHSTWFTERSALENEACDFMAALRDFDKRLFKVDPIPSVAVVEQIASLEQIERSKP